MENHGESTKPESHQAALKSTELETQSVCMHEDQTCLASIHH